MFKILIIDPNLPFQQSLKKLLNKHLSHIDVELAASKEEGLHKLETCLPDLILLEIHLSGESGFEVARGIKSAHSEVIIALLTSYDSPEYQNAVKESGLEYLIPKDIWTGEDIIKLVESIYSDTDNGE
jgi:CheY-like chemotaxis protein